MINFQSIIVLLFLILTLNYANDSEYYTSGSELIPINSKNVELQNEKLIIEYIGNGYFLVKVKYILFNHAKAYNSIVGFEAPYLVKQDFGTIYYDIDYDLKELINMGKKRVKHILPEKKYRKTFYGNPRVGIHYFKAIVNGKRVNYHISKVDNIKPLHPNTPEETYSILLYHFPVSFKEGINTIEYIYIIKSSTSVSKRYEFDYILEPANRWKGNKIKGFTLFLIMPDYSELQITSKSLSGVDNWIVPYGLAKDEDKNIIDMYLKKGLTAISFGDFTPKGKIHIESLNSYGTSLIPQKQLFFDYKNTNSPYNELPFHIESRIFAKDLKSLKILKMLPYARRGYLFKKRYILDYYKNHTKWYKPNPLAIKTKKILTYKEREFLRWIERFKRKILRALPYAIRGYNFKDNNLNLYFSNFDWYNPVDNNKKISKLSHNDIRWIRRIRHIRYVSDTKFFNLLNRYLKDNIQHSIHSIDGNNTMNTKVFKNDNYK